MITKERLEELIEQGATIWVIRSSGIFERLLKNKTFTYDLLSVLVSHFGVPKERWFYIDLFETKEDAWFASKYQNISRFDSLNLPTYEEFIKSYQSFGDDLIPDEKCVIFTCKDGVYSLYACDNEIWVGKDSDGSVMYHKELNKENYIRACDICVKLFKGENIDG